MGALLAGVDVTTICIRSQAQRVDGTSNKLLASSEPIVQCMPLELLKRMPQKGEYVISRDGGHSGVTGEPEPLLSSVVTLCVGNQRNGGRCRNSRGVEEGARSALPGWKLGYARGSCGNSHGFPHSRSIVPRFWCYGPADGNSCDEIARIIRQGCCTEISVSCG